MSVQPSHVSSLPYPPPNQEIVEWFGFVNADAPSLETALKNMRDKASEDFPEANWIIQMAHQHTPGTVYVSGIAVKMDGT